MKLFLVVYDVTFDDDVMETLEQCCVTGFTKWDRVLGKGPHSSPKMDNAIWPGFNCVVAVAVADENCDQVREALRGVSARLDGAGIKIYELSASEVGPA